MNLNLIFKTPEKKNFFFGYYDKSPLDKENNKLLACKVKFINRMPNPSDKIEIGYFNIKDPNTFVKITTTSAWNWQQGCMLQWFRNRSDCLIYNDIHKNKFVTVIYNILKNRKRFLPKAYYALSKSGKFLLCVDNERHYFCRPGYNYQGIINLKKNKPIVHNDGIWRIDVDSGAMVQIITLDKLLKIQPLSNMAQATHYVEHIMINPDDSRFIFMHRWKTIDGGVYSRLYSANVLGEKIFLLNDSGRMSHYCWRNEKEIVGWGGISNYINKLRKYRNSSKYLIKPLMPIYKMLSKGDSVEGNSLISEFVSGDSYILFQDKKMEKRKIAKNILNKDGHPSFSHSNSNIMVTDTYPIKNDDFKQELILYDIVKNKIIDSIKLFHNPDFASTGFRCDLHPKWSPNGKFVCIDTLDRGYRSIYVYEIH